MMMMISVLITRCYKSFGRATSSEWYHLLSNILFCSVSGTFLFRLILSSSLPKVFDITKPLTYNQRWTYGSILSRPNPIQSIHLWIQFDPPGVHNLQPVQSKKYLVLNRTRKLCAASYYNAVFWSWI